MQLTRTVSLLAVLFVLIPAMACPAQPILATTGPLLAQFDLTADFIIPFLLAVVYTVLGIVLFGICIWLVVKIAPFSVQKEIEEDQNIALAVIVGAMILGIAIILAAALAG